MRIFWKALKKYYKDVWHDFCLRQLYNKKDQTWELFELRKGKKLKDYTDYYKSVAEHSNPKKDMIGGII